MRVKDNVCWKNIAIFIWDRKGVNDLEFLQEREPSTQRKTGGYPISFLQDNTKPFTTKKNYVNH